MIHVQIASELTADGVRGVRWVLLEAAEPPLPEAVAATVPAVAAVTGSAPAAPAPAIAPPSASAATDAIADSLRLRLLKALVVALGLGAALWTAAVQIGPPAPVAAPQRMPTLPLPAASSPVSGAPSPSASPALSVAPHSAVDAPASAPAAVPPLPAMPPAAPASAGLPRLTASL